jgi:hypothetical protein
MRDVPRICRRAGTEHPEPELDKGIVVPGKVLEFRFRQSTLNRHEIEEAADSDTLRLQQFFFMSQILFVVALGL